MMNHPRKSLYISILNQGEIRTELVKTIMGYDRDSSYVTAWEFPSDKPISNNRNKIVQRFLKSGCDYLVMIDSDIVPPQNFLELADYGKDVITPLMYAYRDIGIVPLMLERKENQQEYTAEQEYLYRALGLFKPQLREPDKVDYNVMGAMKGENYANKGLVEVDATGTGAIIIKKEVLEDMKAPFIDVFNEEVGDRILGLDLNFCKKVKEKGFKVWVHTDYPCSHWTDMDQKNVYDALTDNEIRIQEVGNRQAEKQK